MAKNEMIFKKLSGGKRFITIGGNRIKVWARYHCTFNTKPGDDLLGRKKRKFRSFLRRELRKLRRGDLFSFARFQWLPNEKNRLRFEVIVPIIEDNPPPTKTTPPPQPAPSGPGSM